MASSSTHLSTTEPASAPRRKNGIENDDFHSPDSTNEELQMASSLSRQYMVEIDKLSVQLRMLPNLSGERCIYHVLYGMKVSDEQLFTPQIVSIGPIHYQNEKLRANEHMKERYLKEFCEFTKVSLEKYYKFVLDQERRLRNCYADVIELNSLIFVKMILVDAAFLLLILVYNSFGSLLSDTDQLFGNPKMMRGIRYDLLLLENQLPFFILEDLYKLSKLQNFLERDFIINFSEETAMTSLGHYFFIDWEITTIPLPQSNIAAVHILDLLRSYLIPADWTPRRKWIKTANIPSTKELHQAGVMIQVGSKENMFDIRFHDGILEVPPLYIQDSTELVFRNLLAFELCHCPNKHIFSDYFEMIRLLTLSSVDTELLIKERVIDNRLPNAQRVSTLIQNTNTGNTIDWSQFLYTDVIEQLNKYYKSNPHKWEKIFKDWGETLKEKYFKAPWAICSVSAAVFLIVLTIIQTVFTILQVVLPK